LDCSLFYVDDFRLPTVGSGAFLTAGAKVWNSLPDDVNSAPTLSTFRRHLKTLIPLLLQHSLILLICCTYSDYSGPHGGAAA